MSHPVIEYLRTNDVKSLEAIGVYARWSTKNPKKLSLNYDQIEAKNGDVLVEHCRGLVIEQTTGEHGGAGEYRVLAWPFRRFYNLGSAFCPAMDWSTAVFEEKMDGTLCIVYFDPTLGEWCVGTRSVPDADIPTTNGPTFAELFWKYTSHTYFCYGATYLYELVGPGNQIVLPYEYWATILLAAVDNKDGRVIPGSAKTMPFADLAAAQKWLSAQPGTATEGFVVRDGSGNRVKIKSAQYLALAKVMTSVGSPAGMMRIILSGTHDDVLPFIPDVRKAELSDYAERMRLFALDMDARVTALLPITDRKEFAQMAMKDPVLKVWSGYAFARFTKKCASFSEWLQSSDCVKNGEHTPSLLNRLVETLGG